MMPRELSHAPLSLLASCGHEYRILPRAARIGQWQEKVMELSAFFPTRHIGHDPAKNRDWAQAAEDMGYAHIEVPDHVFGATGRGDWNPVYMERTRSTGPLPPWLIWPR